MLHFSNTSGSSGTAAPSTTVAGKGTTAIGVSKQTTFILSIGNINLNTINRNAFGNLPCDFKINTSF